MTIGRYLLDLVAGLVALVPVVGGARGVRALLLPGWSGAPARLAEVILGLSIIACVTEVLGLVGWYRTLPIVVSLAAVGTAGWVAGRTWSVEARPQDRVDASDEKPAANELGRGAVWVSLAAVALLYAAWGTWTAHALRNGMDGIDTRWYHLPVAARFVQEGSIVGTHFLEESALTTFYAFNSELFHGFGMLILGNDVLSPMLNLGWLALALLAAWCIGRPFGVAPVTMTGTALLLSTPGMVTTQPGSAINDVVGLALLLGAIAILISAGDRNRWTSAEIAVAALAAGLAIGTKWTFLPAVGAITIGIVVITQRGSRLRTCAVWLGGLTVTGAFWYVRNLVVVGNPIPPLDLEIGPLQLPSPPLDVPINSISEYILDGGVWSRVFLPGLHNAFGPAWWGVVGLAIAGLVAALLQGPDRLERMLAAVGLVGLVVYVFQPQALGFGVGDPVWFQFNLRYSAPALLLGLALLPLVPILSSRRRQWWVLSSLALALLAAQLDPAVWPTELRAGPIAPPVRGVALLGGVAIGATVLLGGAGLLLIRRHAAPMTRATVRSLVIVAAILVVSGGYVVQNYYLDRRYTFGSEYPEPQPIPRVYAWARDVRDARIAIVGNTLQYPLYGKDLSNHVQYVGRRGANGAFFTIETCVEWRQVLNSGDYDYVLVAPPAAFRADSPVALEWTAEDPAASVLLRDGRASVFRLGGELDPEGCGELERSEAPSGTGIGRDGGG